MLDSMDKEGNEIDSDDEEEEYGGEEYGEEEYGVEGGGSCREYYEEYEDEEKHGEEDEEGEGNGNLGKRGHGEDVESEEQIPKKRQKWIVYIYHN